MSAVVAHEFVGTAVLLLCFSSRSGHPGGSVGRLTSMACTVPLPCV